MAIRQGVGSEKARNSATRCRNRWPQPLRARRAVHIRGLQADSGKGVPTYGAKCKVVPYAAAATCEQPQRPQRAAHVWSLQADSGRKIGLADAK
jgi:hypothetical protein